MRERRHRGVLDAVVKNLVVDLIGQNDETVFARHLNDVEKHRIRIENARWVVGVDHHNALRARRHLGADVLNARDPALRFVAEVVNGLCAGKARYGRPERIVRSRNEKFVAFVEERVGGERYQVGSAVAEINILDRDALDLLILRVVHHGLAGREDALAVGVAGRIRKVVDHVAHDLFGRIKAENRKVADIELDETAAFCLHLLSLIHNRTTYVVEDMLKL